MPTELIPIEEGYGFSLAVSCRADGEREYRITTAQGYVKLSTWQLVNLLAKWAMYNNTQNLGKVKAGEGRL